MHSQTIQSIREEIEASQLLETAFRLLAETVDATAASVWSGPTADEVSEMADDGDGALTRAELAELRKRCAQALQTRMDELKRCAAVLVQTNPSQVPAFESMRSRALSTILPSHAAPTLLLEWVLAGALPMDKAHQLLATVREDLARRNAKAVQPAKKPSSARGELKKNASKATVSKKPVPKQASQKAKQKARTRAKAVKAAAPVKKAPSKKATAQTKTAKSASPRKVKKKAAVARKVSAKGRLAKKKTPSSPPRAPAKGAKTTVKRKPNKRSGKR